VGWKTLNCVAGPCPNIPDALNGFGITPQLQRKGEEGHERDVSDDDRCDNRSADSTSTSATLESVEIDFPKRRLRRNRKLD
jgi:hypothetical protein